MLASGDDDIPSNTSATVDNDSDDNCDGPIVAETVHDDDDDDDDAEDSDTLDFPLAGQH